MDGKARRRGAALEDAILDAAWEELMQHGYPGFTLEAVARRAGTSRTVLHRRWPGRVGLTVAAMGRYVAHNSVAVPDLGSVREELTLLLRKLSDRAPPALILLMLDMSKDLAEARSSLIGLRSQIGEAGLVEAILQRGVERGEVDPSRLTPRIASLATDLARHEVIMTLERLSDIAIAEIVDGVVLPLISRARS